MNAVKRLLWAGLKTGLLAMVLACLALATRVLVGYLTILVLQY